MQIPFFSIVTAIKDGLTLFEETAPTVLAQTCRDWEWLIIDDGSIEPVADYARSLGDPRIRVLRNERSIGQTKSLNRGILAAKGDWIVRLDGDDLAEPSRLEATIKAIEADTERGKKVYFVFSDYDVIHEDGAQVATVRYNPNLPPSFYSYLVRKNNPIAHTTVAFLKHAPNGAVYLYDENLRNAQDYALWKRIYLEHGTSFTHLAEVTMRYRLVRQSLSVANAPEQKRELEAIRRADTSGAPDVQLSSLTGSARDGMYAYRVLYFRFIGSSSGTFFWNVQDLHWIAEALRYPEVRLRSVIYGLGRPLSSVLKRILFRRIFI